MSDNTRKKVDVSQVLEGTQKKWKCKYDGKDGSSTDICPAIVLGENTGAHEIVFQITSGSAKFAAQPLDAIWVQRGTKPLQKGSDPQIAGVKLRANGKELVVLDWNDEKTDLYYQLNFDDSTKIDPVITNGGGTNLTDPSGVAETQSTTQKSAETSASLFELGSSAFWILFLTVIVATIIGRLILRLFKL